MQVFQLLLHCIARGGLGTLQLSCLQQEEETKEREEEEEEKKKKGNLTGAKRATRPRHQRCLAVAGWAPSWLARSVHVQEEHEKKFKCQNSTQKTQKYKHKHTHHVQLPHTRIGALAAKLGEIW